ncbi:MAG: autotransporter outer membrane beta-barrel domain-containing protein [Alphaproteobacteria bacterium]|nr:autotransporter outer membrane beta-barrel domain-containing protein [Alphaproteobacteria bacterium]
MSNTKYFADLVKVCSVLPVFAVMPAMANTLDSQLVIDSSEILKLSNVDISWMTADTNGGAIVSAGALNVSGVKFVGNSSQGYGGVAYLLNVDGTTSLNVSDSKFSTNSAYIGGALFGHTNASITLNNTDFEYNTADFGGAVYTATSSGVFTMNGGTVKANTARSAGGLDLFATSFLNDVKFINNKATDATDDGGGALFLGSVSKTYITDAEFRGNTSEADGGAIAMRAPNMGDNSNAKLDIFDTDFVDNSAVMTGGAIYATFYDSVTERNAVYIEDSDFIRNKAETGGAIYNDGRLDKENNKASMKIVDADFNENTATVSGGAIYNTGKLTIVDTDFVGNSAIKLGGAIYSSGKLDLDEVSFVSNSVTEEDGGALFITGGQENNITNSIFEANHADNYSGGAILLQNGVLNIDNTTFVGNTAMESGAIFTYSSQPNTLNITNSVFDSNMALSAGAVQAMYQANISDTVFKNNIATTNSDGAGALFVGAVGKAVLDNVTFENNRADYRGGAISTRSADLGNNKDAKLDVLNSKFIGNKAGTTGGAFDNYLYSSVADDTAVYFEKVEFSANSAALGGAVYNHGAEDRGGNTASTHINGATFVGNIATDAGGAVYNEAKGALMLSGTNTFSGNTVNGKANDIYNDGTFTIASGMTSIDGGINGAGALDIKSGATLNMNYASIEQGTINIDGTLMASLLNDKDSVDVTGALSGAGNVLLSAGAAGVYDVSQFTDANLSVDFGKTYQTSIVDGIATLTARQAAEIAADTGASIAAAGAVSGLANVTDAKLQQVSLMMQEALNSGDIETVEQEVAKVNPNKKPVGQSVSSSVQNQVLTVAAGRMSTVGGTTGRAGGDVTGAGVWAQGMFNKTKMGSAFEGNSRGFAMGGDTLIDNVFTLGGGYAYSSTNVLGGGRDIDVESNSIFVYGQYKPAAWYVNSTLTYTESEYSDAANMAAGFALGSDYDIKAYGAQVMTGYDFASGVTPEVGLRYLHTNQGEHENAFGATVREMDMDFLSGVAGLKYAFEIESDTAVKFSPEMRAAMTYDFISDDATATVVFPGAAAYYVDVDRLSRLGGEFGIGLTAEYRGLELSLNYELDLHKDYTSQTGLFKFRYNF